MCIFMFLAIFWATWPIAPNCTQLHLLVIFTYFDVSRHSEHFCQLHPIALNCTFMWFSHISTFHVILSIFVNCTLLHLPRPLRARYNVKFSMRLIVKESTSQRSIGVQVNTQRCGGLSRSDCLSDRVSWVNCTHCNCTRSVFYGGKNDVILKCGRNIYYCKKCAVTFEL